jgi:hypothetical protein
MEGLGDLQGEMPSRWIEYLVLRWQG